MAKDIISNDDTEFDDFEENDIDSEDDLLDDDSDEDSDIISDDEDESLETETCPICGCEIDDLGCCECDDEYED